MNRRREKKAEAEQAIIKDDVSGMQLQLLTCITGKKSPSFSTKCVSLLTQNKIKNE